MCTPLFSHTLYWYSTVNTDFKVGLVICDLDIYCSDSSREN